MVVLAIVGDSDGYINIGIVVIAEVEAMVIMVIPLVEVVASA